jgi:alkanesulfonate monooxygenase SsuD/methylene tetrahydromethanopterin reductase-like flavin-dependent oxidoreductase (luciferase family)
MRLGCAVFITSLHSPVHLAKSLSTLDQISRGRLEVGVAIGGRDRMFSAFAVDQETFVARFNEGLRLMRALWTEPRRVPS